MDAKRVKSIDIDSAIIGCLQRGILQPSAIAKKLTALDATVVRVWRRLQSMQKRGIIVGYYARLDLSKIGYSRGLLAQITLTKPLTAEKMLEFEVAMRKSPYLIGLHLVADIPADYVAHMVAGSEADCKAHVRWIEKRPHVKLVQAARVLRSPPLPASPPVSLPAT